MPPTRDMKAKQDPDYHDSRAGALRERNRKNAKASRDRRNLYFSDLEQVARELRAKVEANENELKELQKEYARLMDRVAAAQQQKKERLEAAGV